MARKPRSSLGDGVYHVTVRSNRREPIVRDDVDRDYWHTLLEWVSSRFGWLCRAHCLLDDHYHLVVESTCDDLSRGMHQLSGRYAYRFNARHDSLGHLFTGRFHAAVLADTARLEEVTHSVTLHARPGLCDGSAAWPLAALTTPYRPTGRSAGRSPSGDGSTLATRATRAGSHQL